MQKFLVLYMAPAAEMEAWMQKPEVERKEAEVKMKADWDAWMTEHKAMFTGGTAGAGKTKRISETGIEDVKNDVMMFSIIEVESPEVAASAFQNHPHFGIPNAWIEVMPAHFLPGME